MISLAFTSIISVRVNKLIILKQVNTNGKYLFNFNVMCNYVEFVWWNITLISYVDVGYTLIFSPFKNIIKLI